MCRDYFQQRIRSRACHGWMRDRVTLPACRFQETASCCLSAEGTSDTVGGTLPGRRQAAAPVVVPGGRQSVRHASVVQVRARFEVCDTDATRRFVDKSGDSSCPNRRRRASRCSASPSCMKGGAAAARPVRPSGRRTVASPSAADSRESEQRPDRSSAPSAAEAAVFAHARFSRIPPRRHERGWRQGIGFAGLGVRMTRAS